MTLFDLVIYHVCGIVWTVLIFLITEVCAEQVRWSTWFCSIFYCLTKCSQNKHIIQMLYMSVAWFELVTYHFYGMVWTDDLSYLWHGLNWWPIISVAWFELVTYHFYAMVWTGDLSYLWHGLNGWPIMSMAWFELVTYHVCGMAWTGDLSCPGMIQTGDLSAPIMAKWLYGMFQVRILVEHYQW